VARCLAKNPDDRWQSASDLTFDLRALADVQGHQDPGVPRVRKSAAIIWVTGVALSALAGAGVATWLASNRPDRSTRELRLTLLPPPGQEFAGSVARFDMDFAIAPDGTQVAFVAIDASGVQRLWIRSLASMAPRVIPGTEGAERPFWSPDSRFIGFKSEAGISRIALPDGAPQVVVPAAAADGDSKGSWSAGRILFESAQMIGGQPVRTIFMISESGGTITEVPRGKHPASETGRRYPDLLADGRHFIYLSWAPDPQNRGIYLGSFDSDERTLLVKTGFRAEFIAPDTLLYVRDRALVAQRISIESRRAVGEPRIIVEQLALEGIPGQAGFAASDSGIVAYRTMTREVESRLYWIDRKGNASQPLGPKASDISVSLSPDERLVATTRLMLSSGEERLPGNIWLLDPARGVASRFTLDGSRIDENPVWSPDGRKIAYASHSMLALAEVRLQDASEPGHGTVLFEPAENFHPIDWSPDGKYLLLQGYGTGTGADNIDLWIAEPRVGAEPRPLVRLPQLQSQGQFAPDGKWLAYTSDEGGRPEIYLRSFPTGQARTQVSSQGGAQPRWRGDSRELFYVATDGTLMAVPIGPEGTPGPPVALFKEPSLRVNNYVFFYGGAAAYAVSRDGSRFLVNRLTKEPSVGPIHLVLDAAVLR
jgi:Tol biopolymer transport system component